VSENEAADDGSALVMRSIGKRFPGVRALDNVHFDVRAGEVHALLGENGAGKSTLMKILCGVYQPDEGEILLHGARAVIRDPHDARAYGIAIVHQELSLFPNLSVAENIFVGSQPVSGPLRFIDRRASIRAARAHLAPFDVRLDLSAPAGLLSVAQQQVVEIAKALALRARILVLDEPTSALTARETEQLFALVRRLKAQGLAIVYISHRMEEIFEIAYRATVLRDGQFVGAVAVVGTTPDALIRMMVGRQLEQLYGQGGAGGGEGGGEGGDVLRVEGLSAAGRFRDVTFTLRRGEILGFAGLIGAGRSEVARAIFGADRRDTGRVYVDGRAVEIRSPADAMRRGIAYLSEDRQGDGLFLRMSVRQNVTVTHLKRLSRVGLMSRARESRESLSYVRQLRIRTPGVEQQVMNLSGGNQQKVMLARWLAIHPKVLIADEPTRGVDVGAKAEIYELLHALAAEGLGIILISSEMPEVLGMSDRILVMREGRVAGELAGAAATEEAIMALCARPAGTAAGV